VVDLLLLRAGEFAAVSLPIHRDPLIDPLLAIFESRRLPRLQQSEPKRQRTRAESGSVRSHLSIRFCQSLSTRLRLDSPMVPSQLQAGRKGVCL
jgi:hypothetical protein